MKFDYLQTVMVEAEIDVDNIGECVLQGRNDLGEEWYLIIHTEMGWTEVIEYGPAAPDIVLLPHSVAQTYNRFEFSEGKLCGIIDKFLNNPKRGITQADVTDIDAVRKFMINPLDRLFGPVKEDEDE